MILRSLWDCFMSVVLGSEFCHICCVCRFSLPAVIYFTRLVILFIRSSSSVGVVLDEKHVVLGQDPVDSRPVLCSFSKWVLYWKCGFWPGACPWCRLKFCFLWSGSFSFPGPERRSDSFLHHWPMKEPSIACFRDREFSWLPTLGRRGLSSSFCFSQAEVLGSGFNPGVCNLVPIPTWTLSF